MRIGIDFDGVAWSVVDSLGQLEGCPPWKGQVLTLENCDSWDTVVQIWGRDVEFAMRKLDEARHIERLRHFGLFEGFDHAIRTLREHGHEPAILTHNNAESVGHIRAFLDEEGLELEVIDATPDEKIAWCLRNGGAILVDDAPQTILDAAKAGLTVVSPRYLYNAEAIDEAGAIWGHGWHELLPLVLVAAGER